MSRGFFFSLAVQLMLSVAAPPAVYCQSDVTPPVLSGFSFTPATVDISGGPAMVQVTLEATDDLSGIQAATVTFAGPGSPLQFIDCTSTTPVSGTVLDGTYSCPVEIPQASNTGSWTVIQVELQDSDLNSRFYLTTELGTLGFPTELIVTAAPDTTPPTLVDFSFAPATILTLAGPATVQATFDVDDDISGIAWIKVSFSSPGASSLLRGCTSLVFNPESGPEGGGVFSCDIEFPQFSEEGTWNVLNVEVRDVAGNSRSYPAPELALLAFPTELQVVSQSDLTVPSLLEFTFSPAGFDPTLAAGAAGVTLRATDDLSGIASVEVRFIGPGPAVPVNLCTSLAPASGTNLDGYYSCSVPFLTYSSEGTWSAEVEIRDNVGNAGITGTSALDQGGFPSTVEVGFLAGPPRAVVSVPQAGKTIRGGSITLKARLSSGSPADVSGALGIRFESRLLPAGSFAPIAAAHGDHPNPDLTFPYFVHWDTTSVADGDYELRAISHDGPGTPDPLPGTVTVTVDNTGSTEVEENINLDGRQERRTLLDDAQPCRAASGDRTSTGSSIEWSASPGSLVFPTDTVRLTFVDPDGELPRLEQPGQNTGAFIDIALESGQTDLENGQTASIVFGYRDIDDDGIVDGTNIRERDLELRRHDAGSDSYLRVMSWTVLTAHNLVQADSSETGRYALVGPLLPSIRFLADAASINWATVSEALSYRVYRGGLDSFIDSDADGLPDSGYGECRTFSDPDPTDTLFLDPDPAPPPGEGFAYFVSFVSAQGERGLGNTSAGMARQVINPCP